MSRGGLAIGSVRSSATVAGGLARHCLPRLL